MELWTFIHKETNDIIRFSKFDIDDDIGVKYFFTDADYDSPWVSFSKQDLEFIKTRISISPFESSSYKMPNISHINILDYNIHKFKLEY